MCEIIKNQMLAALATLNQCIKNCPKNEWNESHKDAPFSQVLFHVLFYLDYYLSIDEYDFKNQNFHKENKCIFKDYEELENKIPEEIYTKDEILLYLDFCHQKIENFYTGIGNNDLIKITNHKNMALLEISISNIRHIQHHAAQLGLRIQQILDKELKWVATGWKE